MRSSNHLTAMTELCKYLFIAAIVAAVVAISDSGKRKCYHQLATFNTALFPDVPEVEERTDILIQQLQHSSADVFCLQEVWLTETQRKIYREVKDRYPYTVSPIELTEELSYRNDTTPACDADSVDLVSDCAGAHCNSSGDRTPCVLQKCQPALRLLTEPCLACLFIGLRGSHCSSDPARLYKETFGLMLLSKRKLTNITVKKFLPGLISLRAYIISKVDGIGNVVCTHLSTTLAPVYAGPPFTVPFLFSSYAEQQYDELLKLFQEIESLGVSVLMGDFNHGPASPGVTDTWELPFHYGLMNARGFVSSNVMADGQCTWCTDNPVVARGSSAANRILDHIYVNTTMLRRVKRATRLFDSLSTANGTPLSDHYGVQVTMKVNCHQDADVDSPSLHPLPPPQTELDDLCP